MGMNLGYQNPSGTGMEFDFSSSLVMSRVIGKYLGVEYEDGKGNGVCKCE